MSLVCPIACRQPFDTPVGIQSEPDTNGTFGFTDNGDLRGLLLPGCASCKLWRPRRLIESAEGKEKPLRDRRFLVDAKRDSIKEQVDRYTPAVEKTKDFLLHPRHGHETLPGTMARCGRKRFQFSHTTTQRKPNEANGENDPSALGRSRSEGVQVWVKATGGFSSASLYGNACMEPLPISPREPLPDTRALTLYGSENRSLCHPDFYRSKVDRIRQYRANGTRQRIDF